MRQHDRIIS